MLCLHTTLTTQVAQDMGLPGAHVGILPTLPLPLNLAFHPKPPHVHPRRTSWVAPQEQVITSTSQGLRSELFCHSRDRDDKVEDGGDLRCHAP